MKICIKNISHLIFVFSLILVSCSTKKVVEENIAPIGMGSLILSSSDDPDASSRVVVSDLIIDDDIDLEGKTAVFTNQNLIFTNGAKIMNGTVKGSNSLVEDSNIQIFENVIITGSWTSKTSRLEWFLSNFSNAIANFNALTNAITIGETVYLSTIVNISNPNPDIPFNIDKPIKIIGSNVHQNGIIINTKAPNEVTPLFRTPKGNSIFLKNITISTQDYINGILSNREMDYILFGSYYSSITMNAKPSLDYVFVDSCRINGALNLASYGGHSINQSVSEFNENSKVKKINISNTIFKECNAPFSFSNMGYDSIIVSNNQISNSASTFLSIPASGLNDAYYAGLSNMKHYVEFRNNTFENNRIVDVRPERALSPCVIKGGKGDFIFKENTLTNLKSRSTKGLVYTWYYTCESPGSALIMDNVFNNVIGRGDKEHPSSLVKERGASNITMLNNTFEISKQALFDILPNINQDLSLIDGSIMFISLFENSGGNTLNKKYVIKNNVFKVPIINKSTEINDLAHFEFENNKVVIDYFNSSNTRSSVSHDDYLFYGKWPLDHEQHGQASVFISKKNVFEIKASKMRQFKLYQYLDRVQSGSKSALDTVYNYRRVYLSDTIRASNLLVSHSVFDTDTMIVNNTLVGRLNWFDIIDHTGVNSRRPNCKYISLDNTIGTAESSEPSSLIALIPNGHFKIQCPIFTGTEIPILLYNYLIGYHNLHRNMPLDVSLSLKLKMKDNSINDRIIDFRLLDHINFSFPNSLITNNFNIANIPSNSPTFVHQNFVDNVDFCLRKSGDDQILSLMNCENVRSFEIECHIK